jgi:preprotein translocase subunit YajC
MWEYKMRIASYRAIIDLLRIFCCFCVFSKRPQKKKRKKKKKEKKKNKFILKNGI